MAATRATRAGPQLFGGYMKRTPVQRTARVARRVARRLTKLTGGLAMQWMQAMARHATLSAAGLAAALLLGAAVAGGQAAPQAGAPAAAQGAATGGQQGAAAAPKRQLLAEDVYKNIQVLRGVPENQFLSTMGFFAASLTVDCSYCHNSQETWASYAEDNNEHKAMAWKMILMMNAINKTNFAGKREVTCYTCRP